MPGGKICAAVGCTNTDMNVDIRGKVSFHAFPFKWGEKYVKAWVTRLRRENFEPSPYMVVCSEHFEESSFQYQHFTGRRFLKHGSEPTIFQYNTNKRKDRKRTSYQFQDAVSSHAEQEVEPHTKEMGTQTSGDIICDLLSSLNNLQKMNDELKEKLKKKDFSYEALSTRSNDQSDLVKTWTGFTQAKFLAVFNFFSIITCMKISIRKTISPKNQLLLSLIKLRHGLTNNLLAFLFDISPATVSRIFNDVVMTIYKRSKSVTIWPTKNLVQKFMPPDFNGAFPDTRIIIDCCEYFIQQPKNPVHQQASFSTYKNHNTLKALIGIAPSGAISFISELFMGSISDKEITIRSGLLELVEEGDIVLADKGFTCLQSLFNEKKAILRTPHFLRNKDQFNIPERSDNKNISNLRVHVERAISRIKNFKLLDQEIDFGLMGIIEQIHYSICFLTLFLDPLIQNGQYIDDSVSDSNVPQITMHDTLID